MFDEAIWKEWSEKEELNYQILNGRKKFLKKSYLHLDNRFWFPTRKDEFKKIIQNKLVISDPIRGKKRYWAFSPFQRLLVKSPRYKYDEEFKTFNLETKIRPICFAAHIDSLIFGYYAYGLTKKYEGYIFKEGVDECVLAYRSNLNGKSNIQFAKEVFEHIKSRGECTAIALDIKGYFDHIDHKILKENWNKVLKGTIPDDQYKIYKAITRYSYINQSSVFKKYNIDLRKLKRLNKYPRTLLDVVPGSQNFEKYQRLRDDGLVTVNDEPNPMTNRFCGIPQGSSLSALMSNIYLIEFDRLLFAKSREEKFLYRRYCDDILIVCNATQAEQLQNFVVEKISNDFFLTIQSRKVDVTDFFRNSKGKIRAFNRKKIKKRNLKAITAIDEKSVYKSLQYLGFEFDGQNIRIRSSSLSRYFRKMKARLDKTVSMAYSPNAQSDKIFKRQIFERYTHLGKRNFLSYAYKASLKEYTNAEGVVKLGMDSLAIRRQVSRHFSILVNSLNAKNVRRFNLKLNQNKTDKLMQV